MSRLLFAVALSAVALLVLYALRGNHHKDHPKHTKPRPPVKQAHLTQAAAN